MCEYNKDLHLLPFDGMINFYHVGEQIKASGFTGTLMLEVIKKNSNFYDDYTAEQYYEKAFRAASKLRRIVDGE